MKRVLIFGPHPDDIEMGMGGTVFNLNDNGYEVFLCDLTNGEPTPNGTVEKRLAEREIATKQLNIKKRFLLNLPNRYLFDSIDSRRMIAEVIREVKPEILFVPHWNDAHPDHIATCQICEAGRFYAKLTKTNWKGEPYFPKRIIYYIASHLKTVFKPDFIIDISKYIEQKLDLINVYESQFAANNRVEEVRNKLRTLAAYYGRLIGVEYGEGFIMKEIPGLNSLKEFL